MMYTKEKIFKNLRTTKQHLKKLFNTMSRYKNFSFKFMEKNKLKKMIAKIALVFIATIAIVLYIFLKNNVPEHLRINEISFLKGNGTDWIEIYNPTMNNLSMEGLYLSDNANNFSKFKISEEVIVPSHGFTIIYCEGYEENTNNSIITNFRISNGETIYLVAQDGNTIIDSMIAMADDEDESTTTGRFPDGSDEIFIMSQITPGERNQKDMVGDIKQIK